MSNLNTNEYRVAYDAIAAFDNPAHQGLERVRIQSSSVAHAREYFGAVVDNLINLERLDPKNRLKCLSIAEDQLIHEQQHTDAARRVGGVILGYNIVLFRPTTDPTPGFQFQMSWQKPEKTTDLVLASVLAHPSKISLSDLSSLTRIHFTPQEVTKRILEYNASAPEHKQLLLPLSSKI